ncbi:hypothetical protein Q9233_005060 [Columba guinea]|nr:hypothetical protein Q9233_005060 [Columba guinea]
MLVATAATLLAAHCVARHRNALPRLHDLLFRTAGAQEPVGVPDDAETAARTEDGAGAASEPNIDENSTLTRTQLRSEFNTDRNSTLTKTQH